MYSQVKPIVYSCSGCSNLAQMAHDIALNINRDGIAEASCISGVIGKVLPIVEMARGRKIIAIDGCSLACTKACLDACELDAEHHFDISQFGFEKRDIEEYSINESCVALKKVYEKLMESGYSIAANDD